MATKKAPAKKKKAVKKKTVKNTVAKKKTTKKRVMKNKTGKGISRSKKNFVHPLMVNNQSWDKELVMEYVFKMWATTKLGLEPILAAGYEHKGELYNLPNPDTIWNWISKDDKLSETYTRAKAMQMDMLGEGLLDMHEKAWVPILDKDGRPVIVDGQVLKHVNSSSVMALKIEADNHKWLMARLGRVKYGDKVDVGGQVDNPLLILAGQLQGRGLQPGLSYDEEENDD